MSSLASIYTEIADFLVSRPTLEQITEFHLSDTSDQFISHLLELNRTTGLTAEQDEILDDYTIVEHLMQFVKVAAFAKLDKKGKLNE